MAEIAPFDQDNEYALGVLSAPHTLIEYGSYAWSYCRAANGGPDSVARRTG